MQQNNKIYPTIKPGLHPRNKHRERYNFEELTKELPELSRFVHENMYGDESIDFSNPKAVLMLNKALLKHYYGIKKWNIPENYLCPPIPGRADYIHYMADLLGKDGEIPKGSFVRCLDIGVGANCVYPIIGNKEYGWSFVGSDIDPIALQAAGKIINSNLSLKDKVECRLQKNPNDIFYGIIKKNELFDLSLCNPPFHSSKGEAQRVATQKIRNLNTQKKSDKPLNFGGQSNELWCKGGEEVFIKNMVRQSKKFASSCLWFSTLASKKHSLPGIYAALKRSEAYQVETIQMQHGNKNSRIVAWTFFSKEEQNKWKDQRWK